MVSLRQLKSACRQLAEPHLPPGSWFVKNSKQLRKINAVCLSVAPLDPSIPGARMDEQRKSSRLWGP